MKKARNLQYDLCRTIGHAWYEIDATTTTDFGWYFWMKCERCNTERRDTINLRGDLNSRRYIHPEDYKSSEKLTKAEYRELVLQKTHPIRKRRKVA